MMWIDIKVPFFQIVILQKILPDLNVHVPSSVILLQLVEDFDLYSCHI